MSVNAHRIVSVRISAEHDRDVTALRNVVDLAVDAYRNSPAHQMRGPVPGIKRAGFCGADLEDLERALTTLAEATGLGSRIDLSPHMGLTPESNDSTGCQSGTKTEQAQPATDAAMKRASEAAGAELARMRALQLARERSAVVHVLLGALFAGMTDLSKKAAA